MARIVVGVSGASGVILAHRVIDVLTDLDHHVELVMTRDAHFTALEEMGEDFATGVKFVKSFSEEKQTRIRLHGIQDFTAPIASGSYQVYGMLIIPCSMATLAAVATGLSDNLLRRAADVTLKERRPLVIVPREAPFSEIHLENMLKISRYGATIVPPIPAWYTQPKTLQDVENFIVGKALDAMKIESDIYPRWTGSMRR
ncbi:MAG: aromatic acid decarboxylase [Chlamydiia bacterium]|nr:aromatic acid decarboxylase [Chlamydiia bacterium]